MNFQVFDLDYDEHLPIRSTALAMIQNLDEEDITYLKNKLLAMAKTFGKTNTEKILNAVVAELKELKYDNERSDLFTL